MDTINENDRLVDFYREACDTRVDFAEIIVHANANELIEEEKRTQTGIRLTNYTHRILAQPNLPQHIKRN
jgi:hypothetical protein